MIRKSPVILPLATALAALGANTLDTTARAATVPASSPTSEPAERVGPATKPNAVFNTGEALLGLIVTTAADGTVLAQHYSHMSHSSHSSHSSHYSHYSSGY